MYEILVVVLPNIQVIVLWWCAIGYLVSDILKGYNAFIIKYDQWEHFELLTHQHNIISQKTWNL